MRPLRARHGSADGAMVVTNATFTAQAVALAESTEVVLWDRAAVAAELAGGRGRAAQPEELAAAILFLTSAESSFVTGIALPVDGGRTFH